MPVFPYLCMIFKMETQAINNFNAEQAVIEATGGYHIVLAPPGCGKTAVLAERIAWAYSQGVPFDRMACLTFTNRAARGMHERICQRLGNTVEGIDSLFVGNVHRFCSHFLFSQNIVAGHTTVIDTDTSISILADFTGEEELKVLAEAKLRQRYSQVINLQHLMHQCEHRYPKELIVHRDALPGKILKELCKAFSLPYTQESTISLYRNADDFLEREVLLSLEAKNMLTALNVARRYSEYKRQNDLIDFEDLLLLTYEATGKNGVVAPFSWIQVDEVQDLNPLQIAIIDRFTAATPGVPVTVVYLGDAQQAIFSFMGAKTDTLNMLIQRCGEHHVYNFYHNYRSPRYLLDMLNTYGQKKLGIATELLPTTTNSQQQEKGDMVLVCADTSDAEAAMVAHAVKMFYEQHSDETIAVVVPFNSDADAVSKALGSVPHFKISGVDFFTTAPMRLLLAHLGVVAMDYDFIAWAQLLTGLGIYNTNSGARQAVREMMQLAMTPSDLLRDDNTTYTSRFVQAYEQQDLVVFDTETTGLDVFADDVVQIAAVKTRRGRVVDELNIFLRTDRPIPPMLGDVQNPLIEEYRLHEHLDPADGLQRFVDFAKGSAILGHNATYDYQIMEHNMRHHAQGLSMYSLWPQYFDTLKLAHLLHPRQKSYKLRDLLVQLNLEGHNSHLANDDIMATLSLTTECYDRARSITGRQMEFIRLHRNTFLRFRNIYGELYHSAVNSLYIQKPDSPQPLLSMELERVYKVMVEQRRIPRLPKLRYLMNYINHELISPASGTSLAEQLHSHYLDLSTLKEADLCGSGSTGERVFISTVHKAKGLEFDTVFVYAAVDGRYPSAFSNNYGDVNEEARKFYVALSRARHRLIITYSQQYTTPWGRTYQQKLTPYMESIMPYFELYVPQ